MLRNYFLVMIRALYRNKAYSFINIAGLSVGITCSILILLWVFDELSFDTFLPKSDRLYQVWSNATFDGKINSWRSVPLPTHQGMKTADHHIKNACVTDWGGTHLLTVNNNTYTKKAYQASEEFLEMFQFPLKHGDPTLVLDDPQGIVLSESTAKAIFGDTDAMGQTVRLDNAIELKVTGILYDVPKNSSFEFDMLVPYKAWRQVSPWVVENEDNWGNYSFQIFVELDAPESKNAVEDVVRDMLTKNNKEDGDEIKSELFLYPMLRWRLYSTFDDGKETGGMSEYVQMFSIIAAAILAMACINFMNLATARSERRAKEVGVRKSVGSGRWALIGQFIGESIFVTTISFVVALFLTELTLPLYTELVDKKLAIDYLSPTFWGISIAAIVVIGIFSGSYPAFFLSSFQPVKVLKGSYKAGKNAGLPRKVLVTIQFGFAIFLIIGTIVIYQQIELAKNRYLGYDQENLITIDFNDEIKKNYQPFKTELLGSGLVEAVTRSNSSVTDITSNNFLEWPGMPADLKVLFVTVTTAHDYTKTMGIKVIDGRDFSEDFMTDTSAIMVNKTAMKTMNLPEPVIGTELKLWGKQRKLIGVIDDVLMGSIYTEVRPMFMVLADWGGVITIRLKKSDNLTSTLDGVKQIFKKHNPSYPFEYKFVDVEFQQKFTTVNMTSKLSNVFAGLAMFITGLGLFGLAAYTAEKRTKEIGIRKVLGASVMSILVLMSKEFSRLVIISFIVTAPIAWWLIGKYLERYPIRIDIAWWVFPITGLVALVFALFVVTTQAFRAANSDPVKSLRSE